MHKLSFSFSRSHYGLLVGEPDIILPRWKIVVFVHGCFWHWYGCKLLKLLGSNEKFWLNKLSKSIARDRRVVIQLIEAGWRVVTIWECALRDKHAENFFYAEMILIAHWIREKSYVAPTGLGSEKSNAN